MCHINWHMVTEISKDHRAFILRVKHSFLQDCLILKMKAQQFFRMSATTYQITECYITQSLNRSQFSHCHLCYLLSKCTSCTNSLVSHHFQPLFLKLLEYPLILYTDSADVCFPSVCMKNAHFQFSVPLLINVHFSLLNTESFFIQEVTSWQ